MLPRRPKGMHRATYERLLNQVFEAEDLFAERLYLLEERRRKAIGSLRAPVDPCNTVDPSRQPADPCNKVPRCYQSRVTSDPAQQLRLLRRELLLGQDALLVQLGQTLNCAEYILGRRAGRRRDRSIDPG